MKNNKKPRKKKNHRSLDQIRKSLNKTKTNLKIKDPTDWMRKFYQYTNRLAHLYYLRENNVAAFLIFIYFINDTSVNGPRTAGFSEGRHCPGHLLHGCEIWRRQSQWAGPGDHWGCQCNTVRHIESGEAEHIDKVAPRRSCGRCRANAEPEDLWWVPGQQKSIHRPPGVGGSDLGVLGWRRIIWENIVYIFLLFGFWFFFHALQIYLLKLLKNNIP